MVDIDRLPVENLVYLLEARVYIRNHNSDLTNWISIHWGGVEFGVLMYFQIDTEPRDATHLAASSFICFVCCVLCFAI